MTTHAHRERNESTSRNPQKPCPRFAFLAQRQRPRTLALVGVTSGRSSLPALHTGWGLDCVARAGNRQAGGVRELVRLDDASSLRELHFVARTDNRGGRACRSEPALLLSGARA